MKAGDVLHYDVVVTAKSVPSNGARRRRRSCCPRAVPIYTETLGSATGEFLLNCNGDEGIVIAPGETVRFHIELTIPADAPAGPATLTWTPVEPTGTPVTASVTITT